MTLDPQDQPLPEPENSEQKIKPTREQIETHLLACGFEQIHKNCFRKDTIEILFYETESFGTVFNPGEVRVSFFDPVSALELSFYNDPQYDSMGLVMAD